MVCRAGIGFRITQTLRGHCSKTFTRGNEIPIDYLRQMRGLTCTVCSWTDRATTYDYFMRFGSLV